jgi:hypothetical protein
MQRIKRPGRFPEDFLTCVYRARQLFAGRSFSHAGHTVPAHFAGILILTFEMECHMTFHVDAMHTQRGLATQILEMQGHDVFPA